MTRTVLLTLGRLPKALELARSLAAAGCRVLVAEPFSRHLTGASRVVARSHVVTAPAVDRDRYLAELLRIVSTEGVDLVVPVSEEIVYASMLAAHLPPHVRMHCMPHAAILRLHHKQQFVAAAEEFGLEVPETARLGEETADRIAQQHDYVIKPILSCSGRGVRFLARGTALPDPAGSEPLLVQRRIEGQVLTSFSITDRGRVRSTVVYRGAVMSGTVAVCFERLARHRAIEDWVERFVARSDWSGFISFDFVVDPGGCAYAIECNPRATSGIHFMEPASLAEAVLRPEGTQPLRMREQMLMQQLYPCLTETQRTMFGRGPFLSNLRCLLAARDVTWQRNDPWPLLSMPYTSWPIIAGSIRRGVTFGEVATLDVGWYAESPSVAALHDGGVS